MLLFFTTWHSINIKKIQYVRSHLPSLIPSMATDLFSAVSASYYNLCDCMDIAKIAFDYFYRKNRNFTKAVQISRKGQHLGHIWNNLVTLKSMKKRTSLIFNRKRHLTSLAKVVTICPFFSICYYSIVVSYFFFRNSGNSVKTIANPPKN